MKKNKKGFAFSTMLYGTTAIITVILYIILNIVKTSRDTTYYYGEEILKDLNNCISEEIELEECYSSGNINCSITSYRACLGISDSQNENNGVIVSEFLKENVTETGDGLYVDPYMSGRYVYVGNTVNNYILYSGKMWRIVSIEPTGELMLIDVDTKVEKPWDKDSQHEWSGSSLYSFLNNDYLSLIFDQSKLLTRNWYLANVYPTMEPNLSQLINQETFDGQAMTVSGKVGLLRISDYMKATKNAECQEDIFGSENCNSWISEYKGWTIDVNAEISESGIAFLFVNGNKIDEDNTSIDHRLYPTVYLNRNSVIKSGNGSLENPYSLYSETYNPISPVGRQQVNVTAPTVNNQTLVYDGSLKKIAGQAGSCGPGGTMYYYEYDYTSSVAPSFSTSSWTTTYPSNASASNTGIYYMWYYCYVSDTANYYGTDINTVKFVSKRIVDQELVVVPPTVNSQSLVYDGEPKKIAGNPGTCGSGGTMYYYTSSYSLSSAPSFNTTTWTTTYPSNASAITPGTYNMWYYCYVDDSSNYTGTEINIARKVSNEIGKKPLTITANQQTINYGESIKMTPSYVTASGLIPNHSILNINLNPSTSSATTNGMIIATDAVIKNASNNIVTNYYDISYQPGLLIINKVRATISCISNKYENYAVAQTIANCDGGSVQNASQTTAGTYQITCSGDSNHLDALPVNCTLINCPAGYYSTGNSCVRCGANQYTDVSGSPSCNNCYNGYTSSPGATYCCKERKEAIVNQCGYGYYDTDQGRQECDQSKDGRQIFRSCVRQNGRYYCQRCLCTYINDSCYYKDPH